MENTRARTHTPSNTRARTHTHRETDFQNHVRTHEHTQAHQRAHTEKEICQYMLARTHAHTHTEKERVANTRSRAHAHTSCVFSTICSSYNLLQADPEQKRRTEDAVIAWTWKTFVDQKGADPEILLRMPMTKVVPT